jgi:hemoglobin-like flavoprotein
MDPDLLKRTWAEVARYGVDDFILDFYSTLELNNPGIDRLFSDDMRGQRAKITAALNLVIAGAHDLNSVIPTLQRLGRDHRRFGAVPGHFPAVKAALLETLATYLDGAWTPEIEKEWTDAIDAVTGVMLTAAQAAEDAGEPVCWFAAILRVNRRGDDACWLIVDPGPDFPWRPGCKVPVAIVDEPGTGRVYTPEGLPDSTALAIHVKRNDSVSLALLNHHPGDRLRLGAPLCPEES